MPDRTVGPSELADALGCSTRQIYRYRKMGMPKSGRGEYPLTRCAAWFRKHILAPGQNGDEVPDLDEAKLRKEKAKAREAERKLSRRRREVVPADIYGDVTRESTEWIRDTALSRAPHMAEALEGVEGPREAEVVLKDEVRDLLDELHQGPPGWGDNSDEKETRCA